MRHLKMIEDLRPVSVSQFKKMLRGHKDISFTFRTDFDELLDMGAEGAYETDPICGVNNAVDEIFSEFCPHAGGSLSDLSYKVVGFNKRLGAIIVECLASVEELELDDENDEETLLEGLAKG